MLNSDPPKHTRLRLLVSKAFTPAAVDRLAPFIQKIVDDAVDAALAHGSMDIIERPRLSAPRHRHRHMLGVPPEDNDQFKKWVRRHHGHGGQHPGQHQPRAVSPVDPQRAELTAYFRKVVADRRASPRDDLLTAMERAEEQGDRLNEAELFANAVLLLNAGHETTTKLIGNGRGPAGHRDQMLRLARAPSLAPTAIEELLRFDGPVQFTSRLLKEDMTVGGKSLKADSWRCCCSARPTATRPSSRTPTGWM